MQGRRHMLSYRRLFAEGEGEGGAASAKGSPGCFPGQHHTLLWALLVFDESNICQSHGMRRSRFYAYRSDDMSSMPGCLAF